MNGFRAAAIAVALFAAGAGQAATWTRSWGGAPLAMPPARPNEPVPAALSDVTFRMVMRLSSGGTQVRLRLSNEMSPTPLRIGGASLALADAAGAIVPGTERIVRFGGQAGVTIAPGSPFASDPVTLTVPPAAVLVVRLYTPDDVGQATVHSLAAETTLIQPGDRTAPRSSPSATRTSHLRYVLSGVDVLGPSPATIVTLGDSITDGRDAAGDPDRGWPDVLASRLHAAHRPFAVANAGISGNRLLLGGYGPVALARFDRDVLSVPGVRYIVVLEGVNDIGGAVRDKTPLPTADAITAAYRQIIDRAHDRGIKVIGGTILPFKGAFYYSAEADRVRQAVNEWIRTPGHFDGLVDFDRAVADRTDPLTMAAAYDSGDRLHPAKAGYKAMGDAIDLRLFR